MLTAIFFAIYRVTLVMMDPLAVLVLLDSRYNPFTNLIACLETKHTCTLYSNLYLSTLFRETVVSLDLVVHQDFLVPPDLLDLVELVAELETAERV